MKKLHKLKPNQIVYNYNKRSGILITGKITDEICSKFYKFINVPLNQRSMIPILWENGEVGVVFYKHLIVSLKKIIK